MARSILIDLDFEGQARVTGLPAPTAPSDAANKAYVDAAVGASGAEIEPAATYTSGKLSRIDYASGNYKLFVYDVGTGKLDYVDYVVGAVTTRDTINYNLDGKFQNIDRTVL